MGQQKLANLDYIQFENVSFQTDVADDVLVHADLEIPMDQTVIVKSSNPVHAVHVLEILAGIKMPQSGKITWSNQGLIENEDVTSLVHEVRASYFERQRPNPELTVKNLLTNSCDKKLILNAAIEHFEIKKILNKKFKDLSYEMQKMLLLIIPTFKMPQMLVLEDPAVGISEAILLNYLDWVQLWQRQGHLRHVFLTNNHPVAARHFAATEMYVEDGLIYLEEAGVFKKIMNF